MANDGNPYKFAKWPKRRPSWVMLEEGPDGTFVTDGSGRRILRLGGRGVLASSPEHGRNLTLGRAVRTLIEELK